MIQNYTSSAYLQQKEQTKFCTACARNSLPQIHLCLFQQYNYQTCIKILPTQPITLARCYMQLLKYTRYCFIICDANPPCIVSVHVIHSLCYSSCGQLKANIKKSCTPLAVFITTFPREHLYRQVVLIFGQYACFMSYNLASPLCTHPSSCTHAEIPCAAHLECGHITHASYAAIIMVDERQLHGDGSIVDFFSP